MNDQMNGQILLKKSGPYTSIQDHGRVGYQALGIPESGALDSTARRLGNALVGNAPDMAGLEICLGGVELELTAPRRVALTGSVMTAMVLTDQKGNETRILSNRALMLQAGVRLRINNLVATNTAFLAISGGIGTPTLYDSRATSPNAGIGGLDGRLLKDGDTLPLLPNLAGGRDLMLTEFAIYPDIGAIRVVLGPQDDRFTAAAINNFLTTPYRVTPALNRMGMRLEGAVLAHIDNADIASDGIVNGSVQVPGDGQPILLLADHQTTGGYTKIATVIAADLPLLARVGVGDALRFSAISVAEAEDAAHAHEAILTRAIESMLAPPPLTDI